MTHAFAAPENDEELVKIVADFILKGLKEEAMVVGIIEEPQIGEVFREIEARDFELIERAVKDEQIELRTPEETYLAGGEFSPERMIGLLQELVKNSRKRGFKKLFGTGNLGWASKGAPGSDKIFIYEAALNRIAKGNPDVSILCLYEKRAFQEEILKEAALVHGVSARDYRKTAPSGRI
jgi:hypothetical protein